MIDKLESVKKAMESLINGYEYKKDVLTLRDALAELNEVINIIRGKE